MFNEEVELILYCPHCGQAHPFRILTAISEVKLLTSCDYCHEVFDVFYDGRLEKLIITAFVTPDTQKIRPDISKMEKAILEIEQYDLIEKINQQNIEKEKIISIIENISRLICPRDAHLPMEYSICDTDHCDDCWKKSIEDYIGE